MTLCSTLRGVFFILPVLDLEIYSPLYRWKRGKHENQNFYQCEDV